MRALAPMLATLLLVPAGCDPAPRPDPARGAPTSAPPRDPAAATESPAARGPGASTVPLHVVSGKIGASSDEPPAKAGAMPARPSDIVIERPAASLATPKLLAKVEDGGCSLVGLDAHHVYARAPSCKEVLQVDRSSGAIEPKKLPSAMMVQSAADGVAYGCPLRREPGCKLTRVPLDGGPTGEIALLPGFADSPHAAHGTVLGALFLPVRGDGTPDVSTQSGTLETIELTTGARTVIAGPVGVGSVAMGPKGVLFDGARTPGENVRAPSWGLWLYAGPGEPRRLTADDVSGFAADERHVYFVGEANKLFRVGLEGGSVEQITGPIEEPPRPEGKLGVHPGIRVGQDTIYVSTASVDRCLLWAIPKP